MIVTNSSYFLINNSLDVSRTTINGKKDMILKPVYNGFKYTQDSQEIYDMSSGSILG